MICTDPKDFLEQLALHEARLTVDYRRAVPRAVMIVLPKRFHVALETAEDNVYLETDVEADSGLALAQAEALVALVESCGVPVKTFPGIPEQPDGVFSNNVFATIPGRAVIGRMAFPGRQQETQRADIRAWLQEEGYALTDLSTMDGVAEMTGPLIIDRPRNIGLCGMSGRVDEAGLQAMHEALGLDLTWRFDLAPDEYHTNVVLAVPAGRACILAPDAFADPAIPAALETAFKGRYLELSVEEKMAFAGNCLALTPTDLFMSACAEAALSPGNRRAIEALGFTIRSTDLSELELAGGSLRCMVTELY